MTKTMLAAQPLYGTRGLGGSVVASSNIGGGGSICSNGGSTNNVGGGGSTKVQKGWLSRWTSKNWSRHWFVLKNGSLTYYRGPAAELCSFLDGVLDLSLIKHIEVAQQEELVAHSQQGANYQRLMGAANQATISTSTNATSSGAESHFNFTLKMWNGESHVLSAPSAPERQVWLAAISASSDSGCHLSGSQDEETLTDSSSTTSSDSSTSPAGSQLLSTRALITSSATPSAKATTTTSKSNNNNNNSSTYYHHTYVGSAANNNRYLQQKQSFEAEQSLQHFALRLKSSAKKRHEEQELELAVAAAAAASRQQAEQQTMLATLIKRDDSHKCPVDSATATTAENVATAASKTKRQMMASSTSRQRQQLADGSETTNLLASSRKHDNNNSIAKANNKTIASSSRLFAPTTPLPGNKFSNGAGATTFNDENNDANHHANNFNNNHNNNSSHNSTSQTIVARPPLVDGGQKTASEQVNCKLLLEASKVAATKTTTKTAAAAAATTTTTSDNTIVQHEMEQQQKLSEGSPNLAASATVLAEVATRHTSEAHNESNEKHEDDCNDGLEQQHREPKGATLVQASRVVKCENVVAAIESGPNDGGPHNQQVDMSVEQSDETNNLVDSLSSSSANWLESRQNNVLPSKSFSENLMLIQTSGDMKVNEQLDDGEENQLISLLSTSSSSSSSGGSSAADDLLSSEEEEKEEQDDEHENNPTTCDKGVSRGQQFKPMVADDDDEEDDGEIDFMEAESGASMTQQNQLAATRAISVGGSMRRSSASGCSTSTSTSLTKKRVTFDLSLPSLRQISSSSELSSADDSDADSSSLSSPSILSDASLSSASSSSDSEADGEACSMANANETSGKRSLATKARVQGDDLLSSSLLANTRQLAEERRQELRKQLATRMLADGRHSMGSSLNQVVEEQSSGELVRKMIARRRLQQQNLALCNNKNSHENDNGGQHWPTTAAAATTTTTGGAIISPSKVIATDTEMRPQVDASDDANDAQHQVPSSSTALSCEKTSSEQQHQQQHQTNHQHEQLELRLEQAQSTIGNLELRLSDSFASYTKLEQSYKQLQEELIRCDQLHQGDLVRLQARISQLNRELETSELNLVEARDKLAKYEQQLAKTMTLHQQQQKQYQANSTSAFNCLFQQQQQQQQQLSTNSAKQMTNKSAHQFQAIDQLHPHSPKLLMIHQVRQKLDVKQQNLSLKLLNQSKQIHRKLNELELKLDGIHHANYHCHHNQAQESSQLAQSKASKAQ